MGILAPAFAAFFAAAEESGRHAWDFEAEAVGKVSLKWTVAKTGSGKGSVWRIVEDKSAPKGSKVLTQTAESPTAVFNICVAEGPSLKDLDVKVPFKALKGKIDQGGGVVWRYVDADNYYITRFNPLESNFRLYKVVAGKRIQLATKEGLKAPANEWHTLSVSMVGGRIECRLNGRKELEATDSTLQKPGKVGLWTKADAQTSFDDFVVEKQKEKTP